MTLEPGQQQYDEIVRLVQKIKTNQQIIKELQQAGGASEMAAQTCEKWKIDIDKNLKQIQQQVIELQDVPCNEKVQKYLVLTEKLLKEIGVSLREEKQPEQAQPPEPVQIPTTPQKKQKKEKKQKIAIIQINYMIVFSIILFIILIGYRLFKKQYMELIPDSILFSIIQLLSW